MASGFSLQSLKQTLQEANIKRTVQRLLLVFLGGTLTGLGYSLFQVPFSIAAGGVSGLGILINHFTGLPVGVLFLAMNVPILIIGAFYLGGWRFLVYTVFAVIVFSISSDMFNYYIPKVAEVHPLTDDMLLSAIYAGLVTGVGSGLIYRSGGTIGGTAVIARIVQRKSGVPLSQVYLYTDGGIIFAAGLIFGWESALHALLTLFLNGLASDFVLEGPSNVRTAMVVTNQPEALTHALMVGLQRGASHWTITGGYTGQNRSLVFCTIGRQQVAELKYIVAETDPNAFVVIENAHQALGSGFMRLKN